jgi:hypothetical protein
MNDPWNRFPRWPSTEPFGESLGYTADLLEQFMQENNIVNRGDLTPDHGRAVLKAIAESVDPRIQTYRNLIRLFRTLPWLRGGGRGIE